MPNASFDVRMGCDNCGHTAIYHLPMRSRIFDYHSTEEASTYLPPKADTEIYLFCNNCKLPKLSIFWWKDEMAQEVVNIRGDE